MSALDSVLADLVESDRECAYVTVKREPLEALIEEWLTRGDQITILASLVTRAHDELAQLRAAPKPELAHWQRQSLEGMLRELNAARAQQSSTIAHHRHAVRQELAAKLKQALRSAIAEIHTHVTAALLKGDHELAERLESERQTIQIVISATDAAVSALMALDLAKPNPEANKAERHQAHSRIHPPAAMLLEVINGANRIFAGRHNWLSPLTSDEERKQFISRCSEWWNYFVCPAMDRVGAVWNEARQRFEIPERNGSSVS